MFFSSLFLILSILQGAVSARQLAREALEDIQARKYGEARQLLQRAISQEPREPQLWRYLGAADSHLKDIDGAIAAFRKALALAPHDAQSYFDLGVLYLRSGDTARALEVYREGLARDATDPVANRNYAFLLMETGKFREAVQPLQKLKAMKTADLSVRVALIEALLRSGMKDAGKRELADFLASATPLDQIKLANVLIEDRLLASAQDVLEHTVQSAPSLAAARSMLGGLLLSEKRYEEAAFQSGLAARLDPNSARYSMQLAEVLLKWKHFPTALAFLKAVKSRFGILPDYQYDLAWAEYGLDRIPEAAGILDQLTQEHPNLDLPHYSLANCYLALSRLKQAERQYRIAIELNPQKGAYYAALGQVLRKEGAGNADEAIATIEKALELDPGDAASQLQLALCYEETGNLRSAEQLLQAATREQPDLLAAHRVLTRIYYREGKQQEGDRQAAIVTKLDRERLQQRARLMDSSAPPDFHPY